MRTKGKHPRIYYSDTTIGVREPLDLGGGGGGGGR